MTSLLEFTGRAKVLELLKSKWARASDVDDPEPQVVLLTGERGVGKTRLAMEFYRWLSEQVDAKGHNGYWPAASEFLENELAVNPPGHLCKFENDIPYLWWGLRVERDGFARHDDYLAPHMARLLSSTIRRKAAFNSGIVFAKFLADIGTSGVASLVYSTLSAVIEQSGVIRDANNEASVRAALDAPATRVDRVLQHLGAVLGSKPRAIEQPSSLLNSYASTPCVLLIDDAQNWQEDEAFPRFVENLLYNCISQKWPALILITHWQRELAPEVTPQEYSFAGILRHCRRGAPNENGPAASVPGGFLTDAHFLEIPLKKIDDLSQPLAQQLPGLTSDQSERLLVEAGGNPRFLEQIIRYAQEHPRFFEGKDARQPLTEEGLATILAATENHDYYKVVRARLRDAPESVQEAVGLASLQGFRFVEDFVEALGQAQLHREVRSDLRCAEEAYRWVELQRAPGALGVGQFAERVFQQVAEDVRKDLKGFDPDAQVQITFRETVKALVANLIGASDISIPDRQPALLLALEVTAQLLETSADPDERSIAQRALFTAIKIQFQRSSWEEAAAAQERLLKIEEPEAQTTLRVHALDGLSKAYRLLGRASKRTLAIKRRVYEGYRLIGDNGRVLAFAGDPDAVRSYFVEFKDKSFAEWRADTAPKTDEQMEEMAHVLFQSAIRIIVPALLELSEVARTWRDAPPDEHDDPMGDWPFMLRSSTKPEDQDDKEISDLLQRFAYNLGSFVGEEFSRREYLEILHSEAWFLTRSSGRGAAALDALKRAFLIAEDLGDDFARIDTLNKLGVAHGQNGDLSASRDRLLEAGKAWNELAAEPQFEVVEIVEGDTIRHKLAADVRPDEEPLVRQRIGMIGRLRSVYDVDPRKAVEEMRTWTGLVGNVEANLGRNALEAGELDVAEWRYEYAMACFVGIQFGERVAQTLAQLALVAEKKADLAKALKCYQESLSVYRQIKEQNAGAWISPSGISWDAEILGLEDAVARVRAMAEENRSADAEPGVTEAPEQTSQHEPSAARRLGRGFWITVWAFIFIAVVAAAGAMAFVPGGSEMFERLVARALEFAP
ncbi:MAG: ATP-binding protein [Hyphomonadaceae bacterium]|nr:ATP-binding protein [Hyphomonadaceae bacterium]